VWGVQEGGGAEAPRAQEDQPRTAHKHLVGSEEGSYLRLIDLCITAPLRTSATPQSRHWFGVWCLSLKFSVTG